MNNHKLTHLKELEAESIHIIREVAAEFDRPVMLYSVGKDSAVMLHLTRKAFYPGKPPFPLMHVDTTWKFKEMIEFRDKYIKELNKAVQSGYFLNGYIAIHPTQSNWRLEIHGYFHLDQFCRYKYSIVRGADF
jgi:3'-phosphoadenosine 5'-phosphosulfate sulfotransferase (PAPS reductase)/FAD synthetase